MVPGPLPILKACATVIAQATAARPAMAIHGTASDGEEDLGWCALPRPARRCQSQAALLVIPRTGSP